MVRQSMPNRIVAAFMVMPLALMLAVSVSAHAALQSSVPADKATVTTVPTQVALTFSEETSPTRSGGSVTDASGATVSTGFKVDLNDRTKMTIALRPNLPNGVYTVKWNSLTEDDNGAADGTFTFTIQAQATGAGTATTGTAPANGSATAGTAPAPAATTAPTATAATVTPTATRAVTTTVATGTGGGTAATSAPTTLPQTGNGDRGTGASWALALLVAAALAVTAGAVFRARRV